MPRRWPFWTAVALAVLLTAGGVAGAVRASVQRSGPDGAVRGYLAALADADAPTALAYGTVPAGPRALLTSQVLRIQQRLAPIQDIDVGPVQQAGDRAQVRARFTLAFPGDPKRADVTFGTHQSDGEWRLDAVAVATKVLVLQAPDRTTLAGAAVPKDTTLLFPGAVPLTFDTPYLRPSGSQDSVLPGADESTEVLTEVSDAGRAAVLAATRRALDSCLRPGAALDCPLPSERYVPGSLRGTVTGRFDDDVTVSLGSDDAGELRVKGFVTVRGGYRRLEFDNAVTVKKNTTFRVPVQARAYAVAPVRLTWDAPQ